MRCARRKGENGGVRVEGDDIDICNGEWESKEQIIISAETGDHELSNALRASVGIQKEEVAVQEGIW